MNLQLSDLPPGLGTRFEDAMRGLTSVEKLQALTGFRPKTPLTEIIDRVALFFQIKAGGLDLPKAAASSAD